MKAPRHHRRAFTLVEMTIAMSVSALLLGGVSMAMFVASRAIPDSNSPAGATGDAYRAIDDMVAELYTAMAFTERTPTAVTFTVADRDGDNSPETIRYAWSASPGDALTRQYNAAAPVSVTDNVYDLRLLYDLSIRTEEVPAVPAAGSELQLVGFDGTATLTTLDISSGQWIGQCFRPNLPAGTISWGVTRLTFQAAYSGLADGSTLVQLQSESGGLPTGTVLDQTVMSEWKLPAVPQWQPFSFSNVSGLAPTDRLCLVLQHVSSTNSATIQYQTAVAMLPGAAFIRSTDGGGSWNPTATDAMQLYVYGFATTIGQPTSVDHYYLVDMRIALDVGPDASTRVETSAPILNRPEVTGP